jgi:hypothetical protein
MKLAIAIETKDRRLTGGRNYLGETLRNLERAGVLGASQVTAFHIISGGMLPDFFEQEVEPVMKRYVYGFWDAPGTRQQNGARAIRLASRNTDADWVLKLEDDLDCIDDLLGSLERWLQDFGRAQVPMFSLATTFERVGQSRLAGENVLCEGADYPTVRDHLQAGRYYAPHPIKGFYGAQALLWRRPAASALARYLGDDPALWDGQEFVRDRGHDLLLQVWGLTTGYRYVGCAVPSFVQHIGRQSTLNRPDLGHIQPFFEFPFPGREWRYRA